MYLTSHLYYLFDIMLSRICGVGFKTGFRSSFIKAYTLQSRNTTFRSLHSSLFAHNQEHLDAEQSRPLKESNSPNSEKIDEAVQIPDLTPLKYEQNLYATINIHNRPFLVTKGDIIILPFRMKHADIGDALQFTDITTVGSRNYTYHVKEGLPSDAVTIKGIILEKTKKPMYVKEITKKRNRHTRHVQVKHDLTKIRITELKLNV